MADPRLLAGLAGRAESNGWDGLFLWDRRIPVWVAARWPNRRPIRRAVRWDGLFPIDLSGPEQLVVLAEEINQVRGSDDGFDLVVDVAPGADVRQWEAAGATWVLTSIEPQSPEHVVREVIEAGP